MYRPYMIITEFTDSTVYKVGHIHTLPVYYFAGTGCKTKLSILVNFLSVTHKQDA